MDEIRPILAKAGYGRFIGGGIEYDFFCPVRAGDTIEATQAVKDIVERGKKVFVIRETTYTDQNGDLVAKARRIFISY